METEIFLMFLPKENFPIGPIGIDGNACPDVCPAACGIAEQSCPGGVDSNGCMMPDVCTSTTGNFRNCAVIFNVSLTNIIYFIDPTGLGCTVHCPIPCGSGHMTCYGAFDSNGCMMPDTCISMTGRLNRFRYF